MKLLDWISESFSEIIGYILLKIPVLCNPIKLNLDAQFFIKFNQKTNFFSNLIILIRNGQ